MKLTESELHQWRQAREQVKTLQTHLREMDKRQERTATYWDNYYNSNKKAEETKPTVLCNESHRRGLMPYADCRLSRKHFVEFLTVRHERGYHIWAVPLVKLMRRSLILARAVAFLACARADHVAYLYGAADRKNRLGRFICAVMHPICYVLGGLVAETDWKQLYENGGDTAAT